jgi:uracil-DNA glycosylase family 4
VASAMVTFQSMRSSFVPAVSPRELLISDAQNCLLCPRMGESRRVLSVCNGDWNAKVMFVAEAPGRLGAEVTGIPLFGDRTGNRFEELLTAMEWGRSTVFVTNAVLCNPRDSNGNNDKPMAAEINNCSGFLQRTIVVVNPILVIALGRVALEALGAIEPHGCTIRGSCGSVVPWGQRHLGVLYHPSPRTQTQRGWEQQIADAISLAQIARQRLRIKSTLVARPSDVRLR